MLGRIGIVILACTPGHTDPNRMSSPGTRENRSLTPEEQDVEPRAFDNLKNNLPALAKDYERKFGNEVSTDNAREIVSPEYAASKEARTRWSAATQRPAGALADYLFEQALQHVDPDKPRVVAMTAGGTGAGKTTAVSLSRALTDVQFVYDSNLSSRESSVQKIEAAKSAGNQVEILFVHRDPVEALTGGVLPRGHEGRASCTAGSPCANVPRLRRKFPLFDSQVRWRSRSRLYGHR